MARGKPVKAFNADLKQLADRLKIDLGKAVEKVVFELHERVIAEAPVKTGRYRGSWGVNPIDVPNDPGEPPSKSGAPNSIPIEAAKKRVNMNTPDSLVIWWLYNNLPYAEAIENGHSRNAPDGVLDLALATVEAKIDTALETLVLV